MTDIERLEMDSVVGWYYPNVGDIEISVHLMTNVGLPWWLRW